MIFKHNSSIGKRVVNSPNFNFFETNTINFSSIYIFSFTLFIFSSIIFRSIRIKLKLRVSIYKRDKVLGVLSTPFP